MSPAIERARQAMLRVGAKAPAVEFRQALAEAMREAQQVSDEEMGRRFARTRGYEDFRVLLRQAGAPEGVRILAIGSGRRMGGRKAGYAASVALEEYAGAAVREWDWDGGAVDGGISGIEDEGFDLVVTHSFLHYLPDLDPACLRIRRCLKAGGRWVMANEPNARFRNNPECVRERERVEAAESRRRRLRRLLSPRSYVAKARRLLGKPEDEDAFARVGRLVRERLGLRAVLTAPEIIDILEPYRGGLDWADMEGGALAGMRLEAVRTSGYVMRNNAARIPARWRALDERLASRHPRDGCMFSALWRRA